MKLTKKARLLRKLQTDAESLLWYHLRGKRFEGYKFRRQDPIDRYIVDFVCRKHRLIVELDGGQHLESAAYDEERTRYLEAQGYTVIKFWNNELLTQTNNVLEEILNNLKTTR